MKTDQLNATAAFSKHRRAVEDFAGPLIYTQEGYTPHRLRIPLHECARFFGVSLRAFTEVWVDTERVRTGQHFGGERFSTRQWCELAMLRAGMKPGAAA